MDTIQVSPIEVELTVLPSKVNLTVEPTDVILEVSPTEINLNLTPTEVDLTLTPSEINLTVLSGATITNNYGSDTVSVVASENLSGHRMVTMQGYYADKDTATDKFKIVGMTTGAVVSGDTATVQVSGFITEAGWNFTVGSPIFLGANGAITQTVPTSGYRIIIGKPQTATTIFLELSEPITTA